MNALMMKDEMKGKNNTEIVVERIVELHSSTRSEVINCFMENKESYQNFTLVAE